MGFFQDEQDHICYSFSLPASVIVNNTNTKATVFQSSECGRGPPEVVPAYGDTHVDADTLKSVMLA